MVISGAVSVAVIPVVVTSAGPHGWAGIAVAQSIASFIGVAVTFGWAVTGPATVASLPFTGRGQYFGHSLATRIWLGAVGLPMTILLILVLTPGDRSANAVAGVATLLPALGASWFFVGERRPGLLLLLDTLPRAGGTTVGAILLIVFDAPLVLFTASQAAGAAAAVVLGTHSVMRRHDWKPSLHLRSDLRRLQSQTDGVVTAMTAALYVNLPVILVGALLPVQAPVYAVVDKLQKLTLTAIGPVFQVSQGAVGSADAGVRIARARTVSRASILLGVAVSAAFCAAGGPGVALLSGGRIAVPPTVVIALGVALGAVAVSAVVGLACLTALGAVRQVAISTVLGALLGIPAIVMGAAVFGIAGVAVAVAVSELVVTGYQLAVLHRRLGASPPRIGVPPLLGSPSI